MRNRFFKEKEELNKIAEIVTRSLSTLPFLYTNMSYFFFFFSFPSVI